MCLSMLGHVYLDLSTKMQQTSFVSRYISHFLNPHPRSSPEACFLPFQLLEVWRS